MSVTKPHIFPAASKKPPNRFLEHLLWVLLTLLVLWGVHIFEMWRGISLSHWGLLPRDPAGLLGVLTMPFLHGDLEHLVGNSFGLFTLGLVAFQFYERETPWLVLVTMLGGGLMVWTFARPVYHIGSSGIVYGLSAFLFAGALFNRERVYKAPALIVVMLFGSSIWGLFPVYHGVSWEGHFFGALCGVYMAALFRREPPPVVGDEEEEALPIVRDLNRPGDVPLRRLDRPVPRRPFVMTVQPPRTGQADEHTLGPLIGKLPEPFRLREVDEASEENDAESDP